MGFNYYQILKLLLRLLVQSQIVKVFAQILFQIAIIAYAALYAPTALSHEALEANNVQDYG